MSRALRTKLELRAKFPPSLEAVDELVQRFRTGFQALLGHGWFETELLLREALNNAVLHGSKPGSEAPVHCILRMRNQTILISVSDGGTGFAWRKAMTLRPDDSASSGRGLDIYERYADAVRFNHRGNQITLIKRITEQGTNHDRNRY